MPYLDSFRDWNPFDGAELPETLPGNLNRERDRACKLLAGRSWEDLQRAADTLHRMYVAATAGGLAQEIRELEEANQTKRFHSDIGVIRWAVEHLDLQREYALFGEEASPATPAEYFAAYSLAAIGELLLLHHDAERRQSTIAPAPWSYSEITTELNTVALEAIGEAERLVKEAHLVRADRATSGRAGGKRQAARFALLKDECLSRARALAADGQTPPRLAAAVYDSLEPSWRAHFKSKEELQRIDTITRWIRAARTKQR